MSRRTRHGHHAQSAAGARPAHAAASSAPAVDRAPGPVAAPALRAIDPVAAAPVAPPGPAQVEVVAAVRQPEVTAPIPSGASAEPVPIDAAMPAPAPAMPAPVSDGEGPRSTCTQAQLRRFIKSRPWIPMHELRRRFGIFGGDDDVTPVRVGSTTVFVGLPPDEGRMLGELLVSGDVGYELSLDPGAPIVVGVYPMRPVPRG